MSEPFAYAGDVEARWRTLTSDEKNLADQLCEDASNMIRERWPDCEARVTAGTLLPETLERIVANTVKRAMMNGGTEGLESQQQTAGPFSVNSQFANPSGSLYFTNADARILDGKPTRRAFGVDLATAPTCGDYYASDCR